jgi:hypothetical protein
VVSPGGGKVVLRPVFDHFIAAEFAGGLLEHALDAFPAVGAFGLGIVAEVEVVRAGGVEFENGMGGRALET